MDLGLEGRKALVCASSQGLGYACAFALSREGAIVTLNGRDAESAARLAGDDTVDGRLIQRDQRQHRQCAGRLWQLQRAAHLRRGSQLQILILRDQ